ncbi:MAG: YebC/PmpR family DNA-binding transcriptional regulator [Candidatus Omnitrophica bacterium]|nr:YebC/PmpR family DNA-binding transcriptional regulator [Candidatus Omnitrophota bacterium]MBI2173975.1 YebC/PmpR family DNA-binding transcriptional regulator [Candidatus Omnitrophota bacterium]MBI3009728.1 YebC/PmpR family DNA-binding transcriptional regulator [Candidatus Omnitrophota bacterium]
MAGHSKWAGIKHKKAIVDAQRGKAFSKVIRELTSAARLGGGNPEANPRLRLAIQKAREVNVPKDTLEKAIKRGTGDLPGVSYEEMIVEGYGPGGVAILVEALTDNKNRTSAELRSLFSRHQGNIAGAGSVSWIFQKKGLIHVNLKGMQEEALMELALEAGAEDLKVEADLAIVVSSPQAFESVRQALQAKGLTIDSADLSMIPSSTVKVDHPAQAKALLDLLNSLEDQEDTQHVYANFDIPDALLAEHA